MKTHIVIDKKINTFNSSLVDAKKSQFHNNFDLKIHNFNVNQNNIYLLLKYK